jgi:hypothetical protein
MQTNPATMIPPPIQIAARLIRCVHDTAVDFALVLGLRFAPAIVSYLF